MSLGSLLAFSEPLLTPGEEAVIAVAVATMWTNPDKIRSVDEPALDFPSQPRAWIEAMNAADRADLDGRTSTQLLLGDRVEVQEIRGDWVRVTALEQPTSANPRGYPGWLPSYQLATQHGLHVAGVRVAARHRGGDSVDD